MFEVVNDFRLKEGAMASTNENGNNGVFLIPIPQRFRTKSEKTLRKVWQYQVIASDGEGWEHISVSLNHRCLTWDEMCYIKSLFWGVDDCVVQYHPPETEYINNHKYCLHLWRPMDEVMPMPPKHLVGV